MSEASRALEGKAENPEREGPAAKVVMRRTRRIGDAGRERPGPREPRANPVPAVRLDHRAGNHKRALPLCGPFSGREFPPPSANCSTTSCGPTSKRPQSVALEGSTRTGGGPLSRTVSSSRRWPRNSRQAIRSTPVPTANTMSSALGS